MLSLLTRATATPDEVRRLGPLGAFDWCVTKLRDPVSTIRGPTRVVVEIWIEHEDGDEEGPERV